MARSSAIYRSSQQSNLAVRTKYKFPILDPSELVVLYDTMGFDINETVLLRPTSSFMKSLIEQIMDKFLYISPYLIREKVSKISINDRADENDEEVTGGNQVSIDIRPCISIIACQRIMYKFLCDCGVDDFSIRDVSKPESSRLRIILSALINYARFREERMGDFDELMDRNDQTLKDYKVLVEKNRNLSIQINKLEAKLSTQQHVSLESLYNNNEELENQLRSLRSIQKQLTEDHEKYKNEKMILMNELENQSALYIETEKDLEEIRPYIKESPESIKELISKIKESEIKELKIVELLETKLKNISISIDSFQLLHQDLSILGKMVDNLKSDSEKYLALSNKMHSLKSGSTDSNEQAEEFSRKINQLKRQISHNEERIVKLKTFYKEKMKSLEDKIMVQMEEFSSLKAEKNLEDVELSEKESQINNWSFKINEYEKNYQLECRDANFELEKLNSRIKMYISEVKDKISESNDLLSM